MNYDLKRPCANCPFREDITFYLTPGRVTELEDVLVRQQGTFACHKTVDYSDTGDVPRVKEQHCAGAMIMLERMGRPNQMMRIAERLGMCDASALDMSAKVFATFGAMRKRIRELQAGTRRGTPAASATE